MTREETIAKFTEKLKNQEPFSFLKIGDDCIFCMKGQAGSNAELHPYSAMLGTHLNDAYRYSLNQPDIVVTEFGSDNFDSLLLHEDRYLTEDLKEFYKLLKADPQPKYYFARDRMKEAAKVFNMEFIEVPYPDSYSHFEEVMAEVSEIAQPGAILLFSCGMLSKIMVYECHRLWPDMTVIDLGSAFDPLFVGSTRSSDPDQHLRVKEFYNDL